MKMKLLLSVLVLFITSATSGYAAGPYVGAALGVSIIHDSDVKIPSMPEITASYDPGIGLNVSGGYNFNGARLEAEIGYKNAEIDKFSGSGASGFVDNADITIMSYMINGYYDVITPSNVIPYIAAGLGVINAEMELNGEQADDSVFAYQLIAGLGIKINKQVIIDLSYRFQSAVGDAEINGADVELMSSCFLVGMRYNF